MASTFTFGCPMIVGSDNIDLLYNLFFWLLFKILNILIYVVCILIPTALSLQQLANHLKPQHAIPSHRIWPSAHQEICESSGGLSEQNPLCHGFFPLTLLPLNFAKPPLKFAHGRLHDISLQTLGA